MTTQRKTSRKAFLKLAIKYKNDLLGACKYFKIIYFFKLPSYKEGCHYQWMPIEFCVSVHTTSHTSSIISQAFYLLKFHFVIAPWLSHLHLTTYFLLSLLLLIIITFNKYCFWKIYIYLNIHFPLVSCNL